METRRFVLQSGAALAALSSWPARAADTGPFARMAPILARIRPPIFSARDFPLTAHGARENTDCTAAFAAAIAACHAGGGRVLVPAGVWQSGAIHLLSNVNLHLMDGATIRFSQDPKAYPIVRTFWEGNELMNYSPFLYAFGQDNIAITGKGTLDGQADPDHWWNWKPKTVGEDPAIPRNRLHRMAEDKVPVTERVFGEGSFLRPDFIQPFRCRNVLIEGVTLLRSPMWQVHPLECSNVTVRGLTIDASGPNTDGCDPEFCRDVLIEDCRFNTGDDCIAIKSGRNQDGRRVGMATENVIIRRCEMKNGHGGITLGSEISGGVRNVLAEDCRMDSPNLNYALRLKNNAMRGGVLEHFYCRRLTIGEVGVAVLTVDFNYEEGVHGPFTPIARDVLLEHVTLTGKAPKVADLQGFANARIENIVLRDCAFANIAGPSIVKHVQGLVLDNVSVNGRRVTAL